MTEWVISVAGIAILSVLADILLPNGQTKKYTKTVIGIVVTLVLVQPIVQFVSNGSLEITATYHDTYQPQEQYLQYVDNSNANQAFQLKTALMAKGFEVSVRFDEKSSCFVANISQKFSQELLAVAEGVVASANLSYPVEFRWGE